MERVTADSDWLTALTDALNGRAASQTLRRRRAVKIVDSTHVEIDGRRLVNFASNDYLGLTHHPRVVRVWEETARAAGVGSGAAALISGQSTFHESAERAIANWKGTESAVLLSSGYAANLAAVQAIAAVCASGRRGMRFIVDKLAHASLIDAVRSVDPKFRIFPHNHLGKLNRLLEQAEAGKLQVVVTESIFSMDGDAADLGGIAELKKNNQFLLLVDEAHGSGVYGNDGSGYAAELGLTAAVDLTVVTLSKAVGCSGGAVCGSAGWCEAVVNFGRPYIFSTAMPAANAAAVEESLGVMRDEPQRQRRVRELARRLRSALGLEGDSPIVPVVLGDEGRAIAAANELMKQGIFAVAVRPPTVPRGTSRLRLTVSCDQTDADVHQLIETVRGLLMSEQMPGRDAAGVSPPKSHAL